MLTALAQQRNSITDWSSVGVAAGLMTLVNVSIVGFVTATRYRWQFASPALLMVAVGIALPYGAAAVDWLMRANAYAMTPGAPWETLFWLYTSALTATTLCLAAAGVFRFREEMPAMESGTARIARFASTCILLSFFVCLIPVAGAMLRSLDQPDPIAESSQVYHLLQAEMSLLAKSNPKEESLEVLRNADKGGLATELSERTPPSA